MICLLLCLKYVFDIKWCHKQRVRIREESELNPLYDIEGFMGNHQLGPHQLGSYNANSYEHFGHPMHFFLSGWRNPSSKIIGRDEFFGKVEVSRTPRRIDLSMFCYIQNLRPILVYFVRSRILDSLHEKSICGYSVISRTFDNLQKYIPWWEYIPLTH